MLEGKSLIDLSNLSQPATRLVEKISDAIGVMYEPTRIVKTAQAQAYAALIEFNSKNTITELERRAIDSFIKKEAKKQRNIEKITANAIKALPLDAQPQNIDDDWIGQFFKFCDHVSDEEMQRVWGSILAKKSENPRSFSKTTISILALLEPEQAEIFVRLGSASIFMEGFTDTVLFDLDDDLARGIGINLSLVMVLQSLGLVTYSPLGLVIKLKDHYDITIIEDNEYLTIPARYFDKSVTIYNPINRLSDDIFSSKRIQIGCVNLTVAGRELLSICSPTPHDLFLSKFKEEQAKEGILVKYE